MDKLRRGEWSRRYINIDTVMQGVCWDLSYHDGDREDLLLTHHVTHLSFWLALTFWDKRQGDRYQSYL